MVIRPFGDRALLVEVDGLDAVLALHAALAASRPAGVTELVPAARTVLVRYAAADAGTAVRTWIAHAASAPGVAAPRADVPVVLDTVYDGADLGMTAELLGISADTLVAAHETAQWRVAFTGFAPGFGYLVSADWPYDVPRLDAPRTRVPAGSVGLAGGFAGAYPRETPGGWRLIGHTDAPLFDPDATPPALLAPGAPVRFHSVRASAIAPPLPRSTTFVSKHQVADADSVVPRHAVGASRGMPGGKMPGGEIPGGGTPGITVVAPGVFASVQDLGRPGQAALGVARSGALDRAALRRANRLVGNDEGAAGVEAVLGGFRAVAVRDTWFAVTGARGPILLGDRPVDPDAATAWPAGAELHLDWFTAGARAYLAVRGGLMPPAQVGSRSTDTMSGLGPAPLQPGDELPVGLAAQPVPPNDLTPWDAPRDELEVPLGPGPRADWFAASALTALFGSRWVVSAQADRVGVRLDGPELERVRFDELPSEGMLPGALQVPPWGRPTILLADGPVTGGYPVIAVIPDAALDAIGQARPGTGIRFRHAR
jgi:KipI family sensor histidine kinase inhibitor